MSRLACFGIAVSTVFICNSHVALADDVAVPKDGWAGNGSAGYIRTSGNSNTSAASGKLELDYTSMPWLNAFNAAATEGRTAGVTTAETYAVGDKLKFAFNELDYVFGAVTWDSDRFNGIQENFAESVGYGRRLYMTDKQLLDAEVGIGASEQRELGDSAYQTQLIGTVGGTYIYKISNNSQFKQTLRTEVGTQNTFINPVTELKLAVVGNLYASLNYEVRYNTTVPENTHHTDIITSINFGYGFGGKKP